MTESPLAFMRRAGLRELLGHLAEPEDLDALVCAQVPLADLARSGLNGRAALLPLRRETRLRLAAAFELARRRVAEEQPPRARIKGAGEVVDLVSPWLRDEGVEVFHAVLLDARNGVLAAPEVSRGTLSTSLVHPREVFRPAVLAQAAALIVVHNHPSGASDPSPQDDAVTRRLGQAGRILGIPLLDHVIVGGGSYHSYLERRSPHLDSDP